MENADKLTVEAKSKLNNDIERYQRAIELESAPDRAYQVSQDDLALYRQYGDCIHIQTPDVFALGTDKALLVEQQIERYAKGLVTVDHFIERLDQTAWMLQRESD